MSAIIDGSNASSLPADSTINGVTVGKGGGNVSTNTALGASALTTASAGQRLTAVGGSALASSTGNDNAGFGYLTLNATTSGAANTALGTYALALNTTGSNNTSVGDAALYNNTTASNNTAVGYQAGYSNQTGGSNVFIGNTSGYSATASNGFNTFVGASSGYFVTTGYYNTIIGGYSGNQGGLDIRTANNYIVLADGAGNPRGYFDNNGKFTVGGVGTYGVVGAAQSGAGGYCMGTSAANNGGTYYHMNFLEGSTGRGSITSNGSVTLYNTTSDRRLKENIVDAGSGLAKLANVKIRSFDWIENKAHTDFGVIAQELQIVAPEAVSKGETEEDMMSVDTSALVPAMIKAIQELKAEIDQLKAAK